jgi:hypothetical protein
LLFQFFANSEQKIEFAKQKLKESEVYANRLIEFEENLKKLRKKRQSNDRKGRERTRPKDYYVDKQSPNGSNKTSGQFSNENIVV